MKANQRAISLGFLYCIQAGLLLVNSWHTAPGWDEWGHLPSGLYSLQYGDFQPYCVNPPLTRLIAAVPVLIAGGGIDPTPLPNVPGFRSEGLLAVNYIDQQREQTFAWISLARTAVIPIAGLGTHLLWTIGRRFYGPAGGWMAATLWCFSPTVLTFGASITPDVSAAVFGLLAAWRSYIWLRLGTMYHAWLLSLALAMAMLSKLTWVLLPPILLLVTFSYAWRYHRRWVWSIRLRHIALVVSVTWVAVHAGYDFQGMLRPLGEFQFTSSTLSGVEIMPEDSSAILGNRFRDSWLQHVPVPLPADFIRGIDIQKHDFELKMESYLLGQFRDRGWWYYYLVAIAIKEPISLWLMIAFTSIVGRWSNQRPPNRIGEVMVMLPGFAVLILVSTQTGFNHHLRYVLPVFPCIYLLASRSVSGLPKLGRLVCGALLICYAASSVAVMPRSYAFFSEGIGGPENGWRYLGDSNLDWGQDLLAVKKWVEANPNKRPVHLVYSIPLDDFRKLGIDADDGRDYVAGDGPTKPGYWIVFARPMLEEPYRWFRDHDPMFDISVTTKVFVIPPETDDR